MENKNYGEIFCQATEILAQHLIEQISFDRTILCTIVDDSEKNIGKYRVSNTDMTFDAYTSDTNYKIHDNVYVSIPGGDWNEQKLIVSKKANDSETMVEYINPYDRFINITNNIIPTNNLTAGLVANDINKKQILLWSYNSNEDSTLKSGGEVYAGYTRLALSGSFQTLLKSFDVRFGDYGLNLVIKTAASDSDKIAIKVCNLSCADMTGNPYNYQGFFPQAKIFDISNINQVIEMELWFYQKAGSFKNAQGAAIPYENMSSNILVKDINVALGYDTQSFDKDTLILYTQDLTDYDVKEEDEKNHKKLEVRWIHKFDENGKIKVVELNDGIDYNLTFYRHSLGESSHTVWSGVDWAFLSSQTIVEGEASYDYNEDAARDPSYNIIWLKPDYNKAQERIKAILTYNNGEEVLFSSILTINNANEVVSKETINAVSALNINCEDNSNGNYFLYRLDGGILDPAYSKIKRAFKLYFNFYGDTSSILDEAESIEWIVPAKNTMINLYPEQDQIFKISEDNGFYHIKTEEKIIDNNDPNAFNLYYTINSSHRQQNNNNTVKCVVVRNQIEYTAIKELSFGTAGTAGTDYTFVLDFADNRYNALTIGEDKTIEVEAILYDYTGKKLDISNRTIKWSLTTDGNDNSSHKDDGYIIIDDDYIAMDDAVSNKRGLKFNSEKFNSDKPLTEVPDDNYTILKAKLTNWGDFALEAYLPIPIRLSKDYQFISGTTTIVYNSLGNLDINTFQNPYIIYKEDGVVSIDGNWSIRSGIVNDPCIPSLEIAEDGTKLKPISIYVEDTMSKLCITGSIDNEGKSIKVWSQPIYAYQNKYPTSIINDWNGELQINKEGNSILAAKIVAGKKDPENNSFTGVMMGDWNDSNTEDVIKRNTGIYGFRQGAATFGFKDDGTAFIGEAGRGRLEFDGENSIIQSSAMKDSGFGMLLDFDNGYINLSQYVESWPDDQNQNQIWIDARQNSKFPITVGKKEKFKVDWEGNVEAEGKITATSGEIGAWKIADEEEPLKDCYDENGEKINTTGALYSSENYTYFFPDGRIRIGRLNNPKFEVRPDGTLISKGGSITIADGDKTIFEANNDGFNLANGNFIYNKDEDTLRLKGVTLTWQDEQNNTVDLNDYLDTLQSNTNNIQDQLDKRAQTWYQATDPSTNWKELGTEELHLGDLWHYTGETGEVNGVQRVKNSEWVWEEVDENYQWKSIEVSDEVFDKIDGVASIFTTIPENPVVGDLLIPTTDIKDNDITYKKGKVYKFNGTDSGWVEIDYTDDTVAKQALEQAKKGIADAAEGIKLANAASEKAGSAETNAKEYADKQDTSLSETLTKAYKEYTNSEVSELDSSVARYLGLGGNSLIGTDYVVSPYIGGGYLNITDVKNNSNSRVIIDPNDLSGTGYIFQVHNDKQISVGIDRNGNALFQGTIYATDGEFTGSITAGSTITGAEIVGGSILIGEDDDPIFKANKDGATFKGNITMTGGSISWDNIKNITSAPGYGVAASLQSLANGGYEGGTFINKDMICTSKFYATKFGDSNFNANNYTTMTMDGLAIYRDGVDDSSNKPKFEIYVKNDTVEGIPSYGSQIFIALGAGGLGGGLWENTGRFFIEKKYDGNSDYGRIYYKHKNGEYGFKFEGNTISLLEGTKFEGVEGGIAVFG